MTYLFRTIASIGIAMLLLYGAASAAADAKSRHAALAADAKVVAAAAAHLRSPTLLTPQMTQIQLPSLTAETIVQRNVAARGGFPAWERVQGMSMQGKLDAGRQRSDGGNVGLDKREAKALTRQTLTKLATQNVAEKTAQVIQLPFTLDLQRPNKMRLEILFQGDTAVQVFDGTQGWKLRPFLGRHEVEAYSTDELKVAASEQQLDGPLVNHVAKGTRVAVDGAEIVEGHNAYRLQLSFSNGDQRRLWVDSETFLELKIEGAPRHFEGRMRTVATYFKDFRPVDGVQVPRLLETRVEGTRQNERIIVEQVALNPRFDEARFSRPN